MQPEIALPIWRHGCRFKLVRVVHLGLIFCHPFFHLLSPTSHLHPPTKIPVLNDQLSQVQSCMHYIIQVALFHAAYCKKWSSLLKPNKSLTLHDYDTIPHPDLSVPSLAVTQQNLILLIFLCQWHGRFVVNFDQLLGAMCNAHPKAGGYTFCVFNLFCWFHAFLVIFHLKTEVLKTSHPIPCSRGVKSSSIMYPNQFHCPFDQSHHNSSLWM